MGTKHREDSISADRPRTDPSDDRLGHAPFAKQLAASLLRVPRKDGLVVAVYGEWGTGKSTLLNFVIHYLNQAPEAERPVTMAFNPWWFTNRHDLTRVFLSQLHAALAKHKLVKKNVLQGITKYRDLVSELPLPVGAGRAAAQLLDLLKKDVAETKETIVSALRKTLRPIVVVIDDLDRLDGEDIHLLLGTVKALADFPNVIYILALDRDVVVQALQRREGVPGEAYLGKIVQLPFDLPMPDRAALRRLLSERLDAILADTPQEEFDTQYWANLYLEGIDPFIKTPRDVVRFTNALVVTYQAVSGEVNPVDFVAVEALRFFAPPLYDIVRRNPDRFTGVEGSGTLGDSSAAETQRFHESWLNTLGIPEADKEPLKRLLQRLFPRLEGVWGHTHYGHDFESRWRKGRRVCSPDVFDVYFRLSVPEGEVSRAEMEALLSAAGNPEAFGAHLVRLSQQIRLDGTTRARAFLDRLEDYTREDISDQDIPAVVKALFVVGDALRRPEDEERGFFDYGNGLRVSRLLRQLLRRRTQAERFEIARNAIEASESVATILDEVGSFGNEHRKEDGKAVAEEERIVSAEHLPQLEALALTKIRAAAAGGSLLGAPDLAANLYTWKALSSDKEVRAWVGEVTGSDEGFARVVSSFLRTGHRQSVTDTVGTTYYRLDPKALEPFLDVSSAAERATRLVEDTSLAERERVALRQFLQEYEIRKAGGDPNHPVSGLDS